ncbi:MAG: hypothetical protein WC316_04445, partial [Candidatus Omnitrophota bacterium]
MLIKDLKKYLVSLSIAMAISLLSTSSPGGAEESPLDSSQGPHELNFGSLSLEAALNRMYEVDPGIQVYKLACDAAELEIKARKLDTFLPKVSIATNIVKPVNLFTKLRQSDEMFFEQQIVIEFAVTTNSLNNI